MTFAIATTIEKIVTLHGLPKVPVIICTDFISLYDLVVKLGTTKEKYFMIDVTVF